MISKNNLNLSHIENKYSKFFEWLEIKIVKLLDNGIQSLVIRFGERYNHNLDRNDYSVKFIGDAGDEENLKEFITSKNIKMSMVDIQWFLTHVGYFSEITTLEDGRYDMTIDWNKQ
jgi:hypothetical protein